MEELIQLIAQLARKDPATIRPETALNTLGMNSSLGLSILRSMLERRYQRTWPNLHWRMTVGQIFEQVGATDGVAPQSPAPATAPVARVARAATGRAPALPAAFGIGLDLEELAQFPETNDYRAHAFYQSHFTPEEIATALLRPDPRAHFAGIFCAKEALKKAAPEFLELPMREIVVTHDNGRPRIAPARADLAGAFRLDVSITHTASAAAAVVIAVQLHA